MELLWLIFEIQCIIKLSLADKAPAAVVGLVGHKEYEQCAKDLYYFIQVFFILPKLVFFSVCLNCYYSFSCSFVMIILLSVPSEICVLPGFTK